VLSLSAIYHTDIFTKEIIYIG